MYCKSTEGFFCGEGWEMNLSITWLARGMFLYHFIMGV